MTFEKRIISDEFPYFITARCINKEWFRIPIEDVWSIFERHLFGTNHFYDVKVHSFVLMSNHFHLLASTPKGNLGEGMRYLMGETSREITRFSGRINQTYGRPYHATLLKTDHYFRHAYRYLYRNPVDANLVPKAEDYRFSTLHGLLGRSKLVIPLTEDTFLFDEIDNTLEWINAKYDSADRQVLSKALRRSTFQIPKDRNTRKAHRFETDLL